MNRYSYLFPFEKIKYGSSLVIYGAGEVGNEYLKQILITNYCRCVAVLDRNAENISPIVVPVYTPDKVMNLEYDYILLAFRDGSNVQAVRDMLLFYGVDRDKILYQSPRPEIDVLADAVAGDVTLNYAYLLDGISIAIKFGPCLGDAIIKKKIIMELFAMVPDCRIDIYAPGASNFMGAIYDGTPGINLLIDDGGIIFDNNMTQYDAAFELYDLLVVKHISDILANKNKKIFAKMNSLKSALSEYNLPSFPISNMYIHFKRMIYKGFNAYNYINFTGVFNIKDKFVDIKLNDNYLLQYEQLDLGKYVTINYGTGFASQHGKNVIAKQWNYDKLCKLVNLFKTKYPAVKVVQLGTKNAAKVTGVDEYILGYNLEMVKYVLKGSILHIDSEGGLVHLATQLGTKCIVLFGPTMKEYFGYEENDNIAIGSCHDCYTLYDEIDVCARQMDCPECMNKISPELVMEHIDEFFMR